MLSETEPNSRPILIVMPVSEQRGGAELALMQLFGAQTPYRWQVAFLRDGPMVDQVRRLGVEACVIEAGRVRQPHRGISCVLGLARLARRIEAQAMLGWMAKAHVYSGSAARLAGIEAMWFQHGLPRFANPIDHLANWIPAAGVLACSQFSAETQHRATPRMRIEVVHPAVDLGRFDPDSLPSPRECRRALGLAAEGPVVGIFGRLQHWKGMHVLLDALPGVFEKYPGAAAAIVGGPWHLEADYESRLKRQAEELKISDRVIFAGHQQNVAQWMQACDVVVHASDHEPFGIVVVEAMALGKGVVAGDSGGPREIVTHGVDGLLVPFGRPGLMTAAILRYLDDPAAAQKIGLAARRRAQDFSLERFAERACQAISALMPRAQSAQTAACIHAN